MSRGAPRGERVGDPGPAKAISPTLYHSPYLLRYFFLIMLYKENILQGLSNCILYFLCPGYTPQFSQPSRHQESIIKETCLQTYYRGVYPD